jgi:hypothetical protein
VNNAVYRFTFPDPVPIEEVEVSLLLAVVGVQSLHGESRVRLDAGHLFDAEQRRCVIDATTVVGRDLNRLFVGFLRRQFGEDAFKVDRLKTMPRQDAAPIAVAS